MVSQTSQNDPKKTPKAIPNAPHKIRLFLRTVPFRCVPLIFPGMYVVSKMGLCWAYVCLLCLYVGLCWIRLGHVGSCWLKFAQVGLKMRLCWLKLVSRCPRWPPKVSTMSNVKGPMSSILEQKVFVLEHPQAFEKLKTVSVFYFCLHLFFGFVS